MRQLLTYLFNSARDLKFYSSIIFFNTKLIVCNKKTKLIYNFENFISLSLSLLCFFLNIICLHISIVVLCTLIDT